MEQDRSSSSPEPTDEPHPASRLPVSAETMRLMAFEKMEDDYYVGSYQNAVEDAVDSDDESSDDEVQAQLKRIAGIQDKKKVKDAFGRRRRRSDFEDEMDEELDRSITEYASEHMGVSLSPKSIENTTKELQIEDIDNEEKARQEMIRIDEERRREDEQMEQKMAALELLPYDVELTDSEVDPEMPAAVVKNKDGIPVRLVYSAKRGTQFDVEERRRQQKQRRQRLSRARPSEEQRRRNLIRTVAESYADLPDLQKQSREAVAAKGKKEFLPGPNTPGAGLVDPAKAEKHSTPLGSILKKSRANKDESMEVDDDSSFKQPESSSSRTAAVSKYFEKELQEWEKESEPGPSKPKTKKSPKKKVLISEKMETNDADDEEEDNPIKRAAKEREKEIKKNDELLYDDEEDVDNERWVQARRREKRGVSESESKDEVPKEKQTRPRLDNDSDAVLSCPGCMAELTSDCQRHEIYKEQYRAMFVSNCRLEPEKMTVEKTGKEKRRERQKARKSGGNFEVAEKDVFTPVKCSVCNTLVAMMDTDEIYHFFNVLAGYA
ncbi:unnamed protein product [Caenorhabditis auriculariae]|uniref:Uncharacterized protein n=1 Tax=Caenorhabditis auriculariae TaxID=2777116 RepID=A0A8S1GYS7_9PELO|nr:unnamed protein product [Caenorhabditis auriculariae]